MSDASAQADRIGANVAEIRQRLARAAQASGRPANAVRLVAVTKYVSAGLARVVAAAGCSELAESRPQDLWAKAAALADLPVRWHLIGHLQRNKIRRTLPRVALFQSVDSRRLLTALDEQAAAAARNVEGLLEINISGEPAKSGLPPADAIALIEQLGDFPHVHIRGLMGMARLAGGPGAAEADFAALRDLRDRLAARAPAGVTLAELSMGMSDDFEAAIRQGATLVRIGSALFAGCEES